MDPFDNYEQVKRLLIEWHEAKSLHLSQMRGILAGGMPNLEVIERARSAENALHHLVDPLWREPR